MTRKQLPQNLPRIPIKEMYKDITLLGNLHKAQKPTRTSQFFSGWCYVLGKWCYYRTTGHEATLTPSNAWGHAWRKLFSAIAEMQPRPTTDDGEEWTWTDERYTNTGNYAGWCLAMGEWRYYVKDGQTHVLSHPSTNIVHRLLGAVLSRGLKP